MITGTLMFDVEFEAETTEAQDSLILQINEKVKELTGVKSCTMVDSDIDIPDEEIDAEDSDE
jgi:hypothetical protein